MRRTLTANSACLCAWSRACTVNVSRRTRVRVLMDMGARRAIYLVPTVNGVGIVRTIAVVLTVVRVNL